MRENMRLSFQAWVISFRNEFFRFHPFPYTFYNSLSLVPNRILLCQCPTFLLSFIDWWTSWVVSFC